VSSSDHLHLSLVTHVYFEWIQSRKSKFRLCLGAWLCIGVYMILPAYLVMLDW